MFGVTLFETLNMKKLLVITGAGASLEFGMPSVKIIDELFEKWALEILPLKNSSCESLYTWVKQKLDSYFSKNLNNRKEYLLNFENILFTIQSIYSISKDKEYSHFNNRLNSFIQIDEFPEVVKFKKEKKADSFDFHFLHSYLVDKLLESFRDKCNSLTKTKSAEISLLKSFFDTLKTKFELGFINLNYDNVILSTLQNLRTGFDNNGKFKRALVHKPSWDFCYHLHGSIYFDMKGGDDNTEMHKICWNSDLTSVFSQNSSGRSGNTTSEGVDHLSSNIITGLDKSNQLLREPFCSYFMQLDRLTYEADAILFLGYGFNDLHLNNIFPFIRYDKDKIRKVVIVDWASDNEDGLNFRHDGWSHGLFMTLPFNGYEMGTGKNSLPQPAIHFKRKKTLEKSKNPDLPVAIWYNGLLEGCKNAKKILKELT